ncbi:L-cystine transporter [Alkalibacterium kapii]|uniref:L-cystine uptake protein TcyP n=1 Tax=Alkalibacterium kapii TaxID=426704 RepID=A0A511ATQ8_9LACT|nr:L-cystine transporter [Alkalibacterium kapii]GEK91579.1 L-cystine transporter tcyP [Alkalibacterium kapii]
MTIFGIISVLIVFVLILFGLWKLQQKHVKFSTRVFIGLGAGILFGGALQLIFGAENTITNGAMEWINIVGNGYVGFLQMLIMPLIFVSIIGAFTKIQGSKDLGKISSSVLVTLIATTAVAALIGVLSVMAFNLDGAEFVQGDQENARIEQLRESQTAVDDLTIPEQITSFVPRNVFADLSNSRSTSTIAVVVFSAFVGTAYLGIKRKDPEQAEFFKKIIDSLYAIVMRIVTLVLRLSPYGIFALMTKAIATSNFQALINLGLFVAASYTAIAVMFLIHLAILAGFKVNPITYVKKVWPVLTFAFTSRSSAGTLPLNIETQTKVLGVDYASANFAGTFGLSIGQNGCAGIYPATLVAIIAPTVGIDITDPTYILTIMAVVAISSFGVAGVGGGATFAALIVLGSLGLPISIVGLVISVEPIIDMARTMLNVNDSIVAGVISSKTIKQFDESMMNDKNLVLQEEI